MVAWGAHRPLPLSCQAVGPLASELLQPHSRDLPRRNTHTPLSDHLVPHCMSGQPLWFYLHLGASWGRLGGLLDIRGCVWGLLNLLVPFRGQIALLFTPPFAVFCPRALCCIPGNCLIRFPNLLFYRKTEYSGVIQQTHTIEPLYFHFELIAAH